MVNECRKKVPILPLRRAPLQVQVNRQSNGEHSQSPTDDNDGYERLKPAKKSRTSKPKVRTGCQTCKIRRLKCDETKPACYRCTSTGRKCDGYSIPPREKRAKRDILNTTIFSPDRCLNIIPGTSDELRALEFFHGRTAPGLSSYFDADFWTRLVFQMSLAEPAIRHAMVAVGSLHQQRELGIKSVPMLRSIVVHDPSAMSVPVTKHAGGHNDPFALTQYNKAIAHLSKRLQDPVAATEIALLACILFVCVEFIRGDVDPAIKHFKSGMNIAMASLSDQSTSQTAPSAATQRIKETMLPFFNRLELLSTLFGNDASWPYPIELQDTVSTTFTTIQEARDSIVHVMNLGLRFIRSMKYRKYDARLILPDHIARQRALQQQMRTWQSAFDALLLTCTFSTKDLDAAKVLRIHQLILHIWLSASTHAQESSNDAHMADFLTAVSLGEALQARAGTREQRQTHPTTFLFDMEIVSPLYYVAIKCRLPLLRRRAIALLRQTVRREGLWDSNMAAAIATHIMRIEEANLTALDGTQLPDESNRIHHSHIQSLAGLDPEAHTVTFHSRRPGTDGNWLVWSERIYLDGTSSNYTREG